jgi:hypothetical protein
LTKLRRSGKNWQLCGPNLRPVEDLDDMTS